jgi:hypothetical protein
VHSSRGASTQVEAFADDVQTGTGQPKRAQARQHLVDDVTVDARRRGVDQVEHQVEAPRVEDMGYPWGFRAVGRAVTRLSTRRSLKRPKTVQELSDRPRPRTPVAEASITFGLR